MPTATSPQLWHISPVCVCVCSLSPMLHISGGKTAAEKNMFPLFPNPSVAARLDWNMTALILDWFSTASSSTVFFVSFLESTVHKHVIRFVFLFFKWAQCCIKNALCSFVWVLWRRDLINDNVGMVESADKRAPIMYDRELEKSITDIRLCLWSLFNVVLWLPEATNYYNWAEMHGAIKVVL